MFAPSKNASIMETKETIDKMFPGNEALDELAQELGLEIKNKTLLECLDDVVEYARRDNHESRHYDCYYQFNDDLLKSKHYELSVIANAYGISITQAALLSLLIELCKGDDVDRKSLTEQFKIKYVSFLSYEKDLRELQQQKLISKCRWGNLKVSNEVLDALSSGKAYRKPTTSGLTSTKILSRITRLFNGLRSDEGDLKLTLSEIDDMFLSNPKTSLAKVANDYGIIKTDDVYEPDSDNDEVLDFANSMKKEERMLFYALLYRYHDMSDDDCGWWDFRNCFEDDDLDDLKDKYKDERLELQKKEVIEYSNIDGMVVKDRFHLTDAIKEKLLADAGGLHERTPIAGMVLNGSIEKKELFYDSATEKQVESMAQLLSEDRFNAVKASLKANGLRSGFTCLFYGAPGTGKTETVYQLARKTGRDIIMADVTKLKSCWVGESEKNVKNLFSKYRRCVRESKVTPILLFNEADAIFGIRKEGADGAVDKMENSIQNIILQEMEGLDGILIATTNLTQNLDKAFERRFLYKVNFDVPSVEVKSKIWHTMISSLNDNQAMELSSKFDFSGGQIENISRKKMVQAIISGKEPGFEEIVSFCEEEIISGSGNSRAKIGF